MAEPAKIGDYAAIGDGRAVALVSRAGAVDWLCWPRFDSGPLLWRIVDEHRGGTWRIAPSGNAAVERRYLDGSNVVETRFDTGAGVATLTDAMVVAPGGASGGARLAPEHELVRRIRCDVGAVEIDVELALRPDFGRAAARLRDAGPLG